MQTGKKSKKLCWRTFKKDIHLLLLIWDPRFKELDPFIPASERVDVKKNVKLWLLVFIWGTTEESDTSESPTPDDMEENLSSPNSKRQNLAQLLYYLQVCHGLTESIWEVFKLLKVNYVDIKMKKS